MIDSSKLLQDPLLLL